MLPPSGTFTPQGPASPTWPSSAPQIQPPPLPRLFLWFSWREYRHISLATLAGALVVLTALMIVLQSVPRTCATDADEPPVVAQQDGPPVAAEPDIAPIQIALGEHVRNLLPPPAKPTLPTPPVPPVKPAVQTVVLPVVEQLGPPREEEPLVVIRAQPPPAPPQPPKKIFQRFNHQSEEVLRQQLAAAEEVGLGNSGRQVHRELEASMSQSFFGSKGVADASGLLKVRPDLVSLKIQDGIGCVLPLKKAIELDTHSRKLRIYLNTVAPIAPNGLRPVAQLRQRLEADLRNGRPEWLQAAAVPALTQLLMADDAPTRLLLVQLLRRINDKAATVALAQRAVFDLDAEVREEAVEALRGRDPAEWRPIVFEALQYPWSPVADFAAEVLVNLRHENAVPELVYRLRTDRPGRPEITADRRLVIREVVKINHVANCMLCHPPSFRQSDPVVGSDPVVSVPGPPVRITQSGTLVSTGVTGFSRPAGGHDYASLTQPAGPPPVPTLFTRQFRNVRVTRPLVRASIRGDVTWLRQDFSVSYPVLRADQRPPLVQMILDANPVLGRAMGLMPPPVRFDYVVRTRPVEKPEYDRWKKLENNDPSHPQRDALLFALRGLTGRDAGPTTEAWDAAYPHAVAEAKAERLATRLARMDTLQRSAVLLTYLKARGHEYTWALARVLPRLEGPSRELVRQTLIKRLVGQTPEEWRLHVSRPDEHLRRAVVEACREKGDRRLLTELVPLLRSDPATSRLTRQLVHDWTGQVPRPGVH